MMGRTRRMLDWLALGHLTHGLSDGVARAIRTTGVVQVIMIALPTLLLPSVYFVEPPETHLFSFVHYFILMAVFVPARILLHLKHYRTGAALTLLNINYHLSALCGAFADDPAYLGFLVLAILPFLMFPPGFRALRWTFVILPAALFLTHQYYYRVMEGAGLFGPPHWTGAADYFMPPLVLLMVFLILVVYQFVKAVDRAEAQLSREYEKSEKLLLNILPADIASELKLQGSSKPRYFPSTTVCFTDFQGFTGIAEKLSPDELVAELDRCFSFFDGLMDRHSLEKLKTLGDGYMFAGGIPTPNQTHAVDCVLAALEIQAFMDELKASKSQRGLPYWEMRLGIHSGDLVAGVIGEKKFAYDVWSDTVNTASRCESSGVVGRVNISSATYELVKGFFQCEYRGPIQTKSKGSIDMYFVHGLLPELRQDQRPGLPNGLFAERYSALALPPA